MSIPVNKEALQKAIKNNYDKLLKELLTVPKDLSTVLELEGHAKGSMMTINNLLAYLISWGELVLKWDRLKSKNLPIDFPETGYKWNELGELAQKFYRGYANEDFHSLLSKLELVVYEILTLVETKTNQELYGISWYEKWTLGRMIQLNTASPYTNARARIRKWRKERNMN